MFTRTIPTLAALLYVASASIAIAQAPEGSSEPPPADTAKTEAAAPGTAGQGEDHAVKMRGLEERVNDLKEKIFRSKARLMLLRETVLSGAIAGAKALIVHDNQMGSNFVLESASYALDGAPLLNKVDREGDLSDKEKIELFTGSIVPGNHNVSVNLVFRGNGFGVFSYLRGYKFKIRSSYAFTAEEGKLTTVHVVAYEKGGITTDLQDRPAIRYDVEVKADQPDAPAKSAAPEQGGAEQPAPATTAE
ncbi:MAG: dihydrolipoamide acetyltransferase [Deltaproteobacteria bacterium]|nr:dihydrolipoamide acetyltransferase [Deltaproteobacteria bacterium]